MTSKKIANANLFLLTPPKNIKIDKLQKLSSFLKLPKLTKLIKYGVRKQNLHIYVLIAVATDV